MGTRGSPRVRSPLRVLNAKRTLIEGRQHVRFSPWLREKTQPRPCGLSRPRGSSSGNSGKPLCRGSDIAEPIDGWRHKVKISAALRRAADIGTRARWSRRGVRAEDTASIAALRSTLEMRGRCSELLSDPAVVSTSPGRSPTLRRRKPQALTHRCCTSKVARLWMANFGSSMCFMLPACARSAFLEPLEHFGHGVPFRFPHRPIPAIY